MTILLRSQSSEKKLTIYSPQANYPVSILDRDNVEYIGLIDLFEPLGRVEARGDSKWKLQFTPTGSPNSIELEFQNGKRKGKVRGSTCELPANFVLSGGRGFIPISSLPNLLPRALDLTVQLHEAGHRLFIGGTGVKLTAELRRNPARLVLTFPSPVSPFIASEGGTLRLVFSREPIVSSGTDNMNFGDSLITSATFGESNGAAELVVRGTAPLLASFGDSGRTITIAAAPQQATPPAPVPAQPSSGGDVPPAQRTIAAPGATTGPRFLVVIDPAHGGEERGAALTEALSEKDVTLALARRIHRELENKGIAAVLIRTGDSALSFDQRAIAANTARASVYVSIHADTLGSGVRIYTALVPPAPPTTRRSFLPWDTAQAAFLDSSSAAAGSVAAECNSRKIPVRAMAAAIRPLNSISTAAIALELAPPPDGTVDDITSEKYQQSVATAVAAGILAVRPKLEAQR